MELASVVFWSHTGFGNVVPMVNDKLVVLGSNDKRLLTGRINAIRTLDTANVGSSVVFYLKVDGIGPLGWRHSVYIADQPMADAANAYVDRTPDVVIVPARPSESPDQTIARAAWEGEQFRAWMASGQSSNVKWHEWIAKNPFVFA